MTDVLDSDSVRSVRNDVRELLYDDHDLSNAEVLLVLREMVREMELWEEKHLEAGLRRLRQLRTGDSKDGGDLDYVG